MNSVNIILPRATKQHVTSIHIENIAKNRITIFTNREKNLTLRSSLLLTIIGEPSNDLQLTNHFFGDQIFIATTVNNEITYFDLNCACNAKEIMTLRGGLDMSIEEQFANNH